MMTDKDIKAAQIAALSDILDDAAQIRRWSNRLAKYSNLVIKHMRGVLYLVHSFYNEHGGPTYDPITRISHADARALVNKHCIVHSFADLEAQ